MVLPIPNPTKSYWIEAAHSQLRDFRSSDMLPTETDVVIVGSGYTGATTAYWLHKYTENNAQQPRILMLEARDICGGATGRNGGQLRPHAYSRYPLWSSRFGLSGALSLIQHEMAHLPAFTALLTEENLIEETCFKLGETFDAAMTDEAWTRLKGAFDDMQKDLGVNGEVIRDCRLIEDSIEAEEFTQMKGCKGAIVHPSGQIWPYKFVHALLKILLKTDLFDLQANTPVTQVSQRDLKGWITVTTERGVVRTKTVVHATNRWASHLLPSFSNLIFSGRATVAALEAPQSFIKNTGAQHWDSEVNNYHLQLPPPYNTIIIGGAKQLLVHTPASYIRNDSEDQQFPGVPEFYRTWPKSDIVGWDNEKPDELALPTDEGGCWTGVTSSSVDGFPFVGAVPESEGHFLAAGFSGHGMPRILLSTAHIAPLILSSLPLPFVPPSLARPYPPLPAPFQITKERIEKLGSVDANANYAAGIANALQSAVKPFCVKPRVKIPMTV